MKINRVLLDGSNDLDTSPRDRAPVAVAGAPAPLR